MPAMLIPEVFVVYLTMLSVSRLYSVEDKMIDDGLVGIRKDAIVS
jgi:hypothetical protein